MKKIIIIALAAFAAIVLLQDFLKFKNENEPVKPRPYLVVLSIDGFRHDYQNIAHTPTLDSIQKYGIKADGLKPVFPTTTFPNHYSIATGLYPENHGIVSNHFYTPKIKKVYSPDNKEAVANGKFYRGEPIWITAESHKVKTGCYFWVGSEAKIKGYRPTYWKQYRDDFPYSQRADSVIAWLQKPYAERPNLIMWYIDITDDLAHDFSPESEQMKSGIETADSLIGSFLAKANELGIKDSLNFVIVSDHGMKSIANNEVLYLSNYIKDSWMKSVYGGNPYYMIDTEKKYSDSVYNTLKNVQGLSVYRKDEIPDRFRIKNINRISDIVVLADTGNTLLRDMTISLNVSDHGYDNKYRDMYGVLYGIGPAFKEGYSAGDIDNVDLYNMFTQILEIAPAPNDGNIENIQGLLR